MSSTARPAAAATTLAASRRPTAAASASQAVDSLSIQLSSQVESGATRDACQAPPGIGPAVLVPSIDPRNGRPGSLDTNSGRARSAPAARGGCRPDPVEPDMLHPSEAGEMDR